MLILTEILNDYIHNTSNGDTETKGMEAKICIDATKGFPLHICEFYLNFMRGFDLLNRSEE